MSGDAGKGLVSGLLDNESRTLDFLGETEILELMLACMLLIVEFAVDAVTALISCGTPISFIFCML